MTAQVRFQLLGPVAARIDGSDVALGGSKQRTMLAALLLARGALCSDDMLSAMLWGDAPPSTFSAQIYTYASRLRGRLGDHIALVRHSSGYQLCCPDAEVDHEEFLRLTELGRGALDSGAPQEAASLYRDALELSTGPALSGVTEHLAQVRLPAIEEAWLSALDGRLRADLALGMHRQILLELFDVVAEHPLQERLRAYLMLALHRCDRQSDALAVFEQGRQILADELGVYPGRALQRAHQVVLSDGLSDGLSDDLSDDRAPARPTGDLEAVPPGDQPARWSVDAVA